MLSKALVIGAGFLAGVATVVTIRAFADDSKPVLETVAKVEVERYLGKWYEIASIPDGTREGCTATSAEYALNDDGSIRVFNTCRLFDPVNGVVRSIVGRADAVDGTNSKLEVSFFPGQPKGDYWIIELDPDYQWALVGEPSRNGLFLLSRTPTLSPEIASDLLDRAEKKHGYDLGLIVFTPQG